MDAISAFTARLNGTTTSFAPGEHPDGNCLAIVIEGGGMRGVVSAAMMAELERIGLVGVADYLVGTSAGAVNAACGAGGKSQQLAADYAETFTAHEFVNIRDFWRHGYVVKVSNIVDKNDELYGVGSLAAPMNTSPQLVAVATRVEDARAFPLTNFRDGAHLTAALKASALLPIVGGDPVRLDGHRWLDGGVAEAVPLPTAASLGATHALVLATRPLGTAPSFSGADRLVLRYLRTLNPDLVKVYAPRAERYRTTMESAADGEFEGVKTAVLTPRPGDVLPSRTSRNKEQVEQARVMARETTLNFLRKHGLADSADAAS